MTQCCFKLVSNIIVLFIDPPAVRFSTTTPLTVRSTAVSQLNSKNRPIKTHQSFLETVVITHFVMWSWMIVLTDSQSSSVHCWNSCNLMRQAPFTACDTDPEPFITACTNTLCKYPAVDGLKCQFFDAYARSCSLEKNITLENWGSKTGCCKISVLYDEMWRDKTIGVCCVLSKVLLSEIWVS